MIKDIVRTFIEDLKNTPEYKEAWNNCEETKDIVFNFSDLKFYNRKEDMKDFPHDNISNFVEIVMDEELLLGE